MRNDNISTRRCTLFRVGCMRGLCVCVCVCECVCVCVCVCLRVSVCVCVLLEC